MYLNRENVLKVKRIRYELKQIMDKFGTSLSFVARQTGVNVSTINLIMKRGELDYNLGEDKIRAIEKFINERRVFTLQ